MLSNVPPLLLTNEVLLQCDVMRDSHQPQLHASRVFWGAHSLLLSRHLLKCNIYINYFKELASLVLYIKKTCAFNSMTPILAISEPQPVRYHGNPHSSYFGERYGHHALAAHCLHQCTVLTFSSLNTHNCKNLENILIQLLDNFKFLSASRDPVLSLSESLDVYKYSHSC